MAVSLSIDINKLLESKQLLNLISRFFNVDSEDGTIKKIKKLPNKKIIEAISKSTKPTHVEFINPDDDRTSDICKSLVGKVWKIGNPNIKVPPLHFNCRSSLSYISYDN